MFGDPVVATAILHRLLHHSHVLTIRGDSYRVREKRRSGLIKASSLEQELAKESESPASPWPVPHIARGPVSDIVRQAGKPSLSLRLQLAAPAKPPQACFMRRTDA
jgi:IstB-like ATP binding protein